MTDSFKGIRNRHKVATMPIPGPVWDASPPEVQLALLQIEAAKFAASMHQQEWGGFQIVVVREGQDEAEVVLSVGGKEEKKSGLIVPERQLIMPN